jgi:DNA repair exonuclease SbcCD nuclease subunit
MDLSSYKVETQHIDYKRIFLLSDLHFGVRANSLEWLSNQLNFFNNFYIPYLKENVQKGDVLFILGDWFDNRQLLDIYVMNISIDIVLSLADIIPIYFMTGNHDIYKKYDTDVNSIIAFKHIPNVTIFEKPLIASNGQKNVLVLPWIGTREHEALYVQANKFDYIFAHTDIVGFQYDNGREIKLNATDFNLYKGIKRVFSGHIHKRQERDNIIYIGSPYHTKRSDIGNNKGVYLFEPNSNELYFNLNNLSSIFQRIPLEDLLELTLEEASKILDNNYTDIIVPDKFIHLFNLTKFIEILQDCNYKKIETVGERKKNDDFLSDLDGVDIRDILTLLEMSIDDLGHNMEVLVKLKLLNRRYYERSQKEETF